MKTKPTIEKSNLLSEIEVSYKSKQKASERTKITQSADIYKALREVWSNKLEHVEEVLLLCLNRANQILGWAKISQGGFSGTVCDAKVIFQIALNANCSSIVLAHNHPSGNLKPSEADIRLTNKIKQGAELLDLVLLDHLIITEESYYSFSDEGMM